MSKGDAYIKIERKDDGASLQLFGKEIDLLALLGAAIHQIYASSDESSRIVFRHALISLLTDPESPVWDPTVDGEGTHIVIPHVKEDEE